MEEDEDSFEIDDSSLIFPQEADEMEVCDNEKLKPCQNDLSLKMLFQTMDIAYCYQSFIECGFTHERLRYLSKEDLELIFPGKHNIGLRAELREKIFQWKAINFPVYEKQEPQVTTSERTCVPERPFNFEAKNCESLNSSNFATTTSTTSRAENCNATQSFDETSESDFTVNVNSVQEILQKSKTGKFLLAKYAETKKLDNSDRKKLTNVITEHFVSEKDFTKPSPQVLKTLAEEIVQIFPNECRDIYYISRNESLKRYPMGILFNKFNNIMRGDRKNYFQPKEKSPINEKKFEPILKSQQSKMIFMTGKENDALSIWSTTYDYRLSEIRLAEDLNLIIEQWPFFKCADAYKFIEYDFEKLYPNAQYKLMDKWYDFKKQLLNLFKTYIKDKHYQQLLHSVKGIAYEEDSTDCIFAILLCAVLRSSGRYSRKIDGKYVLSTLRIKDTVDSLIIHIKSFSELKKIKEQKRQYSYQRKMKIPPYIVVIGEELNDLMEFYVVYGKALQKFSLFVPALDFCFKTFHVFHLTYPMESSLVWTFFQKHIYEIHKTNDLKSPRLSEILDYYKTTK